MEQCPNLSLTAQTKSNALRLIDEILCGRIPRHAPGSRNKPVDDYTHGRLPNGVTVSSQRLCHHLKLAPDGRFRLSPEVIAGLYFCRAWLEVVYDHWSDNDSYLLDEIDVQFTPLYISVEGNLTEKEQVKLFKYWTAYPMYRKMAQCKFDNPRPPHPFPALPHIPFSGKIKRFIQNRIIANNDKAWSFCWSLLQGVKRACAVVPKSFFVESLVDHVKALTQPPRMLSDETRSFLIRSTSMFLKSAEWKQNLEFDISLKPQEISQSSTFRAKRSAGGGRSELLTEFNSVVEFEHGQITIQDNFTMQSHRGKLHQDPLFVAPNFLELVGLPSSTSNMMVHPLGEALKVRVITKAEAPVTHVGRTLQKPLHNLLRHDPVFTALDRPLDTSDFANLLTREKQSVSAFSVDFWKRLCSHSTQPLSISKVHSGFKTRDCVINPESDPFYESFESYWNRGGLCFVSGDYKAATDNLSIEATRAVFQAIILNLQESSFAQSRPLVFRDLVNCYQKNLEGIRLYYPKIFWDAVSPDSSYSDLYLQSKVDEDGDRYYDMMTGQLMGSILSFPILCLANFSSYLLAFQEFFFKYLFEVFHNLSCQDFLCSNQFSVDEIPEYELSQVREGLLQGFFSPEHLSYSSCQQIQECFDLCLSQVLHTTSFGVLVNGDDILFRCNSEFYGIWKDKISDIGFTLSIGKNYCNPSYFTINSQLYRFLRDSPDSLLGPSLFEKIDYLNVGLLVSDKGLPASEWKPLDSRYNEVIGSAMKPSRCMRRFIHYHKVEIQEKVGKKANLFLPCALGGAGFISPRLLPRFKTESEKSRKDVSDHLTPIQYRFATTQLSRMHYNQRVLVSVRKISELTRYFPLAQYMMEKPFRDQALWTVPGVKHFMFQSIYDPLLPGVSPGKPQTHNPINQIRRSVEKGWVEFDSINFDKVRTPTGFDARIHDFPIPRLLECSVKFPFRLVSVSHLFSMNDIWESKRTLGLLPHQPKPVPPEMRDLMD